MSKITEAPYRNFLNQVVCEINRARLEAGHAVNRSLISLYFNIGKLIVQRQNEHGWGKAIVQKLSADLKKLFDSSRGFSSQNLWYMRQFYLEYEDRKDLADLAMQIPWGQNLLVISRIKDYESRKYYLETTRQMGWSRNVLLNQIKAEAYERQCLEKSQHNFEQALSVHLAEQADEAMKSSYNLDFLGLTRPVRERELENRLTEKVRDFIMELGYGFCFIGNQYKLQVGEKEYFIDLLFFHRKLRSLVAVELKTGPFEPEYAGKVGFYLNVLDQQLKMENENPSIGIVLCAEKDHIEVEFALKTVNRPVGVAEYQLTRKLPKKIRTQLPSAEALESEIKEQLKPPGS